MTARNKFQVTQRVVINRTAPSHQGEMATVVGFCRDQRNVRILRDGAKKVASWSMDFLDPVVGHVESTTNAKLELDR